MRKIYEHIFEKKHNLGDGHYDKFDPDYYMALSWQRLRNANGRDIQDCDLVMLHHELEEAKIMERDPSVDYRLAHEKAVIKYDYEKALNEYLKSKGINIHGDV